MGKDDVVLLLQSNAKLGAHASLPPISTADVAKRAVGKVGKAGAGAGAGASQRTGSGSPGSRDQLGGRRLAGN